MAFPITLTNAVDGTTIVAAALHNAVEAKIGIDSSAVVTSLDYLLKNSASVDPGHKHTKSGIICDVATGYVLVSGGVDAAAVWSATPTLTSLTTPTLYGSAASGGNLQLHSTSHATKGKIYLGSTATVDDANSRFGIGTTSPSYKLTVYDDATHYIHIGKGAGGIAARTAQQWVGGTCTCNFDIIDDTHAWLGVVQNLPIHLGTNDLTRLTISGAGAIQFTAYGAGALTTDASGNITAVSDMRHKQFRRLFAKGMAELQAIDPIVYKWRPESGMETEHEYVGFSAQNVQESLPEAVGKDSQGYLTLQDRAILAAVVNAVKGQQAQIDALMAQ